jgi:hypothetical protein
MVSAKPSKAERQTPASRVTTAVSSLDEPRVERTSPRWLPAGVPAADMMGSSRHKSVTVNALSQETNGVTAAMRY